MSILICVMAALALQQPHARPDPRVVIVEATRAVEGDSAALAARGWAERLARDASNVEAALGMATLARLRYDYPASDTGYARLIRRAGSADAYTAAARLEWGRSLQVRGRNAHADSQYVAAAAAARQASAASLEASALLALAALRARTMGPAAADSLLQQAGARIAPQDLHTRAEYHCTRASLWQMTGGDGVESEGRAGAELARRAGAIRQQAYCLRIVAIAVMNRDRLDEGFALLRDVIEQLRAARDRAALASVLQWRGYNYYMAFEYGLAHEDLRGAVAEGSAAGAQSPVAWALLNLCQLSAGAGDLVSAREYGDRAGVMFEAQRDYWGLGTLRSCQGQAAYQADDRPAAKKFFTGALAAAEALGYAPPIVAAHTGLAVVAMRDIDLATAEHHLNAARDVTVRHQLTAWGRGLSYHYARLALLRGQLDVAERELRTVVRGPMTRAGQPGVEYEWRARLADVLTRQGRIAEAEAELRYATNALDSMRSRLTGQELRTVVLQNLRETHDPSFGVPRVLAGMVAHGRGAAAFELADRRKAGHLLDRMILRAALLDEAGAHALDSKRYLSPTVTLQDVAAALPERTALLEYVTGEEGAPTTLFVITRGGVTAMLLAPLDSIARDVRRFLTLTEEGSDPRHLARTLGATLLDPALARISARVDRLVIVPDAGLHRLPFDALITDDGRRVVERFSTSSAPSAAVAVELWKRPVNGAPVELLAFGDPAHPRSAGSVAAGGPGALERLKHSGREARLVARYAPAATVRVREEASESFLRNASLRRYRIVHFAAHALVDEQTPLRTALALAPGDGADGFVSGGDLAALDLDADLVVLSACRTAGGAYVYGEGVEGLTSPLLEAGARAVIASNWRVGDRAAADFVRSFYRALAAGHPAGEALTVAKRDALRSGHPPAVWAAFTLVGNPDVAVPLRHPSPLAAFWMAVVGAIAMIGYRAMRRSRSADRTRTPSAVTASTHQRIRSPEASDVVAGRTRDVSD